MYFSALLLAQFAFTNDIFAAMENTEKQIDVLFRDIFTIPSITEELGGNVMDFRNIGRKKCSVE